MLWFVMTEVGATFPFTLSENSLIVPPCAAAFVGDENECGSRGFTDAGLGLNRNGIMSNAAAAGAAAVPGVAVWKCHRGRAILRAGARCERQREANAR